MIDVQGLYALPHMDVMINYSSMCVSYTVLFYCLQRENPYRGVLCTYVCIVEEMPSTAMMLAREESVIPVPMGKIT